MYQEFLHKEQPSKSSRTGEAGSVWWPEAGACGHGALLRLCRAQKAVGRFCAVLYSCCRNRGISAMRD